MDEIENTCWTFSELLVLAAYLEGIFQMVGL